MLGQEEKGKGSDVVLVSDETIDEGRPFKIGRGAGIIDRWNVEDLVSDKIVQARPEGLREASQLADLSQQANQVLCFRGSR